MGWWESEPGAGRQLNDTRLLQEKNKLRTNVMNTSITSSNAMPLSAPSNPSGRTSGVLSRDNLIGATSWALSGWAAFVFLSSLPYKFSGHPTTQHIFTTIGAWISETVSAPLGLAFSSQGATGIGSIELVTSLALLMPAVLWLYSLAVRRHVGPSRSTFHAIGGAMAAALMSGAVFFHLFTPLGVQVVVDGVSDGGTLFRAAVTVLVAGLLLVTLNARSVLKK